MSAGSTSPAAKQGSRCTSWTPEQVVQVFKEVVTALLGMTPAGGQRLLFSATLDRGVDKLVRQFLSDPAMHAVASDTLLSQRDLAQLLQVDKSTVSRLAADLERDGLIERVRDPDHHRQYQLRLTDLGRNVAQQMSRAMTSRFERWVAAMAPEERAALLQGLPALIRAVRESPE